MKLILLPLLLLIFSSVLSLAVMYGGISTSDNFSSDYSDSGVSGSQSLNEEESELIMQGASFDVSITLGVGVFAWVVTSIAFAGIIGINVLGSGLAEVSVMALFRFASLYAIWLMFSIPASALFLTVPFGFGIIFYFMLTFFYSYGIIAGGSGMVGGS